MTAVSEATQSSPARWVILVLACCGLFGQFYAYDIPSALNEQLRRSLTKSTGISDDEYAYLFSFLYSVYSIPNVILPLVLGISIDRCGYRVLIALLGLCVFLGQVLFTVGIAEASWPIMIAGRILFGLGGESLQVAQSVLLFRWFKGNEVAFALGLNLSIARCGSVLNDWLSPWIVQRSGLVGATSFGAALVLGSFLCNVGSVALDKYEGERARIPEARGDETFTPRDLLNLPKLYWLLVVMSVTVYCGILPFNNIASAFFIETRYSGLPLAQAQTMAGGAMSLLFLSSAIGTPPFGLLVDKVGLRRHFLLGSALMLLATYTLIFIVSPAMSMFMLGLVYMVFAGAMWPAIALTVPERQLGTAYGIVMSLINAGLAIVPMIVGHMQATSKKGDWRPVIQLLSMFGLVGTVTCYGILAGGLPQSELLDLPSAEAERRQKLCETSPLQRHAAEVVTGIPTKGLRQRDV